MKRIPFWLRGLILTWFVCAAPVLAHHGTNISYDHNKPITLSGTVTEFVWANPHCQLYFDVKDANGKVTHWAVELNSVSVLGREGWTKRQFQPGDQITITVFPSKARTTVGVADRTHPILANGVERVKARTQTFD